MLVVPASDGNRAGTKRVSTLVTEFPARVAFFGVVALTLLCVLWELWLAPLRPGGSWLVLKALPLALMIAPVARGNRKALQVLALLLPFYVAEGIVRGWSESGRHALVAWSAATVALSTFAAALVRLRGRRQN